MKIAILSDSHDHKENILLAVKKVTELGATVLLFCGDLCSPPVSLALCEFKGQIYFCFGNNDGDPLNIYQKMTGIHDQVTIFKEGEGVFELGKCKIAMTHYPIYGEALAQTGRYDLVVFGHDHQARILRFGKTLAINPGCLNLAKPKTKESFALYDTATHAATLHALDGSILTI